MPRIFLTITPRARRSRVHIEENMRLVDDDYLSQSKTELLWCLAYNNEKSSPRACIKSFQPRPFQMQIILFIYA